MKVVIVGAGIIGTLTGLRLAQAGAQVAIVEAGQPAGAASGASFGWINASFFADKHHFHLRQAAIEAHRRLAGALETQAVRWPGCLCWEQEGLAFDAEHAELRAMGYDVRVVGAAEFAALEPGIAPPERALHFPQEGVVDLAALVRDALAAGAALGMQLIAGVPVTRIATRGGAVCGVDTAAGRIAADRVVVAGGVGTTALLAGVDVALPMLRRPGLILRSVPLPPLLRHVLVAPGQELRQDGDGCLLAPTVAGHQSDAGEEVPDAPDVLADRAAARIAALLGRPVPWAQVSLAQRPVPQDGLPVIGACGPSGLYVSTMHSGATLAALAAELAAAEIAGQALTNMQAEMLAPYRPGRFKA